MKRLKRISRSIEKQVVKKDPYGDFDRDGVINILDCEPTDPRKHGIEPNIETWKRLESLPIYFNEDAITGKKLVHISDKNAKHLTPHVRQRFLTLIKKFPYAISSIEQSGVDQIIFSDTRGKQKRGTHRFAVGLTKRTDYDPKHTVVFVSLGGKRGAKTLMTQWDEGQINTAANTLFHELQHVKQFKTLGASKRVGMSKGRYEQKPIEVEAERVAGKKVARLFAPPAGTRKSRMSFFQKMFRK